MQSIFTSREYETNWTPVFGDSVQVFLDPVLILNLSRLVKGALKRSIFQISPPFLIETRQSGAIESYLDVSLMIFEAFVEEHETGDKQGFHLNGEFFYTDSKSDLDDCIQTFQKICVFSHIEDYFVLIKEIGIGSTSTVYMAEDIEKHQKFAVKCIKKSYLEKPQSLRNLSNEIKIMRNLMIRNRRVKNLCLTSP